MNIIGGGTSLSQAIPKTAFGEMSVAENQVLTGWNFPFNINPNMVRSTVLNAGSVTHVDNYALIQSGVNANGSASIRTEAQLAYTPGIGGLVRFTAVFSDPQEGAMQIVGLGDDNDGLFFGFHGLRFGILRRSRTVDTWVYQEDWSVNPRPDYDYTKGVPFEIKFQWLGYGMQYFGMEDDSGAISDVHRINYSNKFADTSIDVPSLPITMMVSNGGVNTTNVTLQSPSAVAMSQGEAFPESFTTLIGYSYLQAVASGSNYLFTIRNPATYFLKANKLYISPILLTLTNEAVKTVTFTMLFNSVLTTPTFTNLDENISPAQVDTVAAAYTGGTEIMTFTVRGGGGASFDFQSILSHEKIWPNSTITMIAEAGGSGDVTVGLTLRSRV